MSPYIVPVTPTVALPIVGSSLLFPVRRVYCVALNYADHAKEMGNAIATRQPPIFFSKFHDAQSIVPAHEGETITVAYPPMTQRLEHEIEVAIAIGHAGYQLQDTAQAQNLILGYAAALDLTRRDIQAQLKQKGKPWEMAKAFDQALPIGAITLADQIEDLSQSALTLYNNDRLVQHGFVHQMLWSIPELLVHLSQYVHLYPGDVLLTGTPAGVAPVSVGDRLQVGIERLATFDVMFTALEIRD